MAKTMMIIIIMIMIMNDDDNNDDDDVVVIIIDDDADAVMRTGEHKREVCWCLLLLADGLDGDASEGDHVHKTLVLG